MTLSVCLIVKDEQEVLARCLDCVQKFADEIIVADTGSSDGTVSIARKYTDKVFSFGWCDDFSAARNFAFSKATGGLIMWLDADDVITDENCEKIARLKDNFADYDMAFLPYAASFEGNEPAFVYYRERIVRSGKGFRFEGAVHEAIAPSGKILYSDAVIYHKKVRENSPLRNLAILQKSIASGKTLDPRSKFYYGRELLFNNMPLEAIAVLEDFLRGGGWSVNMVEACENIYSAYMSLGEEQKAIEALLRAFTIAPPNPKACCILGEYFMKKGRAQSAIYWYRTALISPADEKSGAFIDRDYCGFIPYMQLCVLYDSLGDSKKAYECNLAAGRIKPQNESYLYNVKYFNKLGFNEVNK